MLGLVDVEQVDEQLLNERCLALQNGNGECEQHVAAAALGVECL